VGSLQGQQIGPIRSGQAGAFNRPPQIPELAFLQPQLFALQLSGI
jgi:hypothetical protein